MYKNKKICIIVPAYNEEKLVRKTIETIPDFADHIVVINDASDDSTKEIVEKVAAVNNKVLLITHEKNRGVGAAIGTGYVWSRDNDIDIAVVVAGDGQMNPNDMTALLDPIVEDRADYTKGNRLITGEAWQKIPRIRYFGNSMLTLLTKIASGYWHVTDSQCGYTALNKTGLHHIPFKNIYPRYGMPNDFLVTLNVYNMRVMDVEVEPIYGIGEKSGMKLYKVVFSLLYLMMKLFFRRMFHKYIIRDFHPLVFFYAFGIFLLLMDIPLLIRLILRWNFDATVTPINSLAILFCTLIGIQSLFFAMLFDMEANRELKGK